MSTVRRLALQLGVEHVVIRNSVSEIDKDPGSPAKNVKIRGYDIVSVDVDGTRPGLPYDTLSHYEKLSVDLEFAIALARATSAFRPTLLILDAPIGALDELSLQRCIDRLQSRESHFQTIIVTWNDRVRWSGWQLIQLDGNPPSVTVTLRDD